MKQIHFFIVGLCLIAVVQVIGATEKWGRMSAPFAAFEKYLEAVAKAQKPDDLSPFITADKKERQKTIPIEEVLKEFAVIKAYSPAIEVLYYQTKLRGALAVLTLEGIDLNKNVPATWIVNMVDEPTGWKFRSMDVRLKRDPIQLKVREWTIGKDLTPVQAMLKHYDKKTITLVHGDMQLLEVPFKELSEADLRYIVEYERSVELHVKEARARLTEKAQAAGLLPEK